MVQLSIGSRSLSKMMQGAQLEAALQQLAKQGAFNAHLTGVPEMNDPDRQSYLN